jgi:hypothetical protein
MPEPLRELAQFQRGVISRKQAVDCGLAADVVKSRVRHGRWQRLHPGIYAVFTGPPPRESVLWAAVLRAGRAAMLSLQTAAELFGLTDEPSTLIHLTVPGERRVIQIPGCVIHGAAGSARARHPTLAPPRTRIEETVLDLTQSAATFEAAYGWATRAVGRRLTTPARPSEAMSWRHRVRWRGPLTEALSSGWDGIHSGLEHRYTRDVERPHGLPRSIRQVRVMRGTRVEYRDALYQSYDVAVELDGRVAHPGDLRWRDIRRDNAALADGVITLRYGWTDVTGHPCAVARQVAEVLRRRGWTGPIRPCRAGCSASRRPLKPPRLTQP